MMRKTILKAAKEMEPLQRKNLFKTTCKCRNKVCKIFIDSGSTKNMVSSEMVNKLNLQKIPHEFPYKVSWLSDGNMFWLMNKLL